MKKINSIVCAFVLVFTFGCDDEPLDPALQNSNCEQAMLNTAVATQNFVSLTDENYEEEYPTVCAELKSALEAQLLACGDPDGSLQATIDSMLCSLDPDPCEAAVAAVVIAEQVYNNASEEEYTDACNLYAAALQNKIVECGDADGSIQATIDSLGDCSMDTGSDTPLEGIWLLTAWNSSEAVDINNDGSPSVDLLNEFDCYNNETMVFEADNTGAIINSSYADIAMELVVGTDNEYDYTVSCIQEEETFNMTWVQNGNTVTITDEFGDLSEWTLNGNQLSLFVPEGFFVGNEDFSVTTITDLTFVYTKQ